MSASLLVEEQARILSPLLESMSIGLIMVDSSGAVTARNHTVQEMLGIEAPEAKLQDWSRAYGLYLPDQVTFIPCDQLPLVRALRGEVVQEVDSFVRNAAHPEGKWIIVSARPLWAGDAVQGAMLVCHNATELTKAQRELERSRDEIRRQLAEIEELYRTAPVGLCVLDRQLRFVRVNEWLARIDGKPSSDHIGLSVRDVVPELADRVEPLLRRVLESGRPLTNVQIQGTTPGDPHNERTWIAHY